MGKYYQKILTRHISPIIDIFQLHLLTKSIYSGRGQILMFHRVIPYSKKKRIHNHLSLEISPEQLTSIISYYKRRDYDFIDLDKLPKWLLIEKNNKKRFVIFTFDDGYRDNLYFAYPILKKHNIPFTIYLTTSFPDKHAILWWYILEEIIINFSCIKYSFKNIEVNIDCSSYTQKEIAYTQLRKFISELNKGNFEVELNSFFSNFGFNINKYNEEMCITWDEIKKLSRDPLVTIGAHTINHYNLCNLSNENSFLEISECKKLIESKINSEVKHFSYPLGGYGLREIGFVRKSEYLTATTTKTANIFHDHTEHLLALPRISINALTTDKVLNLHANGFFPAILNNLKRVVY